MKEIKFEEALVNLEKIVADMESDELSLDNSLEKYEEGIKLIRFCTKKLNEAEQKIEILTKQEDGSIERIPFEDYTEDNNRKKKTAIKKKEKSKAATLKESETENEIETEEETEIETEDGFLF